MRRGTARRSLQCVAVIALCSATALRAAPIDPPLPPAAPRPSTPAPAQTLPPYEDNLERLSEVLGVLAFMRDLCGEQADPDWRAKMADLLEAEGATEQRRARLAGSFNHGYESYRLIYRTCTPAARIVVARSLTRGAQLSGSLSKLFSFD